MANLRTTRDDMNPTNRLSQTTLAGGYPADVDNPDDWAAFLSRYLDNRATNAVHNGIGLVALHIVDALQDARKQTTVRQRSFEAGFEHGRDYEASSGSNYPNPSCLQRYEYWVKSHE